MKYLSTIFGVIALGGSLMVNATPITDVQEYDNNTATEYFVDGDTNKYSNNYYRGANQDWSWTHEAIAGSNFSSIELNISAYDVDYDGYGGYQGERDMIYVFDGQDWLGFGDLDGSNDVWDFTSFDLSNYAWAESQVNAGLQVKMDIDTYNEGWLVTLGKSTLSIDGGNQQCVPTPGNPCVAVPGPTSLGILLLGLVGYTLNRKLKVKK